MGVFKKHYIRVKGYKIATFAYGKGDKVLLIIHGGPGSSSKMLREHHTSYANLGYQVITWDQLGCGESDIPSDDTYYTVEHFTEELEEIVNQLKLTNIHLVGRSWGGIIAIEYCLKNPDKVNKLILGNTTADIPMMQRGFERCKQNLGLETTRMMCRYEAEGTTEHPEYRSAIILLSYRHFCRLNEWPKELNSLTKSSHNRCRDILFGKNLFNCTGTLRNYSRLSEIHFIKIPTLIMHGEFDYISLECAIFMQTAIPNAKLELFRNCSHLIFLENTEHYHKVLTDFLQKSG